MESIMTLGRLGTLEAYDSAKDPKDWLRIFDKVVVACEWTNARRLNMAYAYLKGEADKWLESEDTEDWTWDTFSTRLTERFSRLRSKLNVRREFETRTQLKNETARTFQVELRHLASKLPEDVPDDALLHRFIQGLNSQLRQKVHLRIPQTLKEAQEAAEYFKAIDDKFGPDILPDVAVRTFQGPRRLIVRALRTTEVALHRSRPPHPRLHPKLHKATPTQPVLRRMHVPDPWRTTSTS
jgi:hypothetical protein